MNKLPVLIFATIGFAYVPAKAHALEFFGRCIVGPCEDKEAAADAALIDPKRYEIEFVATGASPEVEDVVKSASELYRGRDEPVGGSAGVIARAKGDYRRILAALYNEGYYGGSISILVAGDEAANLSVGSAFTSGQKIVVRVDTGNEYKFGRATVNGAAPATDDKNDQVPSFIDVAFASGLTAKAGNVGKASKLARDAWRQLGYPLAKVTDKRANANHPANELNVELDVDAGQRATYGEVQVNGTERMNAEFVARQTGLKNGEEYDPDDLVRAQKRIDRLGVFSSRKLREAEALNADGSLPLFLDVDERKLRRIGAGATLSSIDGVGLETFWLHRNLFGKAERLRLDAKVSGLGTTLDYQQFDYNFGAEFTKPGVFNPDTDLNVRLIASREVFDDFTQLIGGGSAYLTHFYSDSLTLNGGLFAEYYRFEQSATKQDFVSAGLTASFEYDTRDNKLDATQGFFIRGDVKPFYEFNYSNAGMRTEAEARAYVGLGENARTVLAGRLLAGSVFGPVRNETPDNLLFFAGGGGSVRGYGFNNIGVVETSGDIGGGQSKLEASAEVRFKFTEKFGAVAFADAGVVSKGAIPNFSEDLKVGVGVGIRYYTGLGPIRLDVALPLNKRDGDPNFGIYAGIGQAF